MQALKQTLQMKFALGIKSEVEPEVYNEMQ